MHTQEMVDVTLKTRSETRNSDIILWVQICNEFRHAGITQTQLEIFLEIQPDTVSRIARDLRSKGMYLWDEATQEERKAKEAMMRERYWPDWRKHLLEVMQRNKQKMEQEQQKELPF